MDEGQEGRWQDGEEGKGAIKAEHALRVGQERRTEERERDREGHEREIEMIRRGGKEETGENKMKE